MGDWNPTSSLLGLEWAPDTASSSSIRASDYDVAVVHSTTTETVTGLRAASGSTIATAVGPGVIADICAIGQEVPTGLTVTRYQPTSEADRNAWTTQSGGTTNLYQTVDEGTTAFTYTDHIIDTNPGSLNSARIRFMFSGAGAFPADRRIANVVIVAWTRGGAVTFGFDRGGIPYGVRTTGYKGISSSNNGFSLTRFEYGELCPWTGLPWTRADVQELTSTTRVRAHRGDSSSGYFVPTVAALEVAVVHYAENRQAVGFGVTAPGTAVHVLPIMDGSWAKAAGTSYSIILRPSEWSSPNPLSWAHVESTSEQPTPSWIGGVRRVRAHGGFEQSFSVAPIPRSLLSEILPYRAKHLIMDLASGKSADSQPYSRIVETNTATTTAQRVIPSASKTYAAVRVLAEIPTVASDPRRLRVTIRRVSDNVVMGDAGDLLREDVLARGTRIGPYWMAQITLSVPAPLVSGTAYSIVFTQPDGIAWNVYGLLDTTDGGLFVNGDTTYGGTTSYATFNGTAWTDGGDIPVVLGEQPTPVSGFEVEILEQALAAAYDPDEGRDDTDNDEDIEFGGIVP